MPSESRSAPAASRQADKTGRIWKVKFSSKRSKSGEQQQRELQSNQLQQQPNAGGNSAKAAVSGAATDSERPKDLVPDDPCLTGRDSQSSSEGAGDYAQSASSRCITFNSLEARPLCAKVAGVGNEEPLVTRLSWWVRTVGLWLGLLLLSILMAALLAYVTRVQQIERASQTISNTPRPVISVKQLDPRQKEYLAVCCHHVTAFGVQPNISWGTATLEQQATWQKWNCESVLKRRFGTMEDAPEKCLSLGDMPYTFYIYRVTGDTDWPIENVNVASLGGVLWYLHNEVIVARPRKWGIRHMRRFKVKVAGTRALLKRNMTFGVRFAYDTQVCTGAGPWASPQECDAQYEKYGYFVGCNNLGSYPFPTAAKGYPNHYPEAVWYSLPGEGLCHGEPTGEPNCTYSFEEKGSIPIDEIVGIKDYGSLPPWWREYDSGKDTGVGFSWWDHKFDSAACHQRWQHVKDTWARKFPGMETDDDLPPPSCDFRCSFYPNPPLECTQPQPTGGKACSNPGWCSQVQRSYHAPHVGHYRLLANDSSAGNRIRGHGASDSIFT